VHAAAVASRASHRVLSGLGGEVLGILRRHWVAAAPPAALLGAGAAAIALVHDNLAAEIALGLALAIAFEMYVGYAELIVAADRGTAPRPPMHILLVRAVPLTTPLVAASVVAVAVPLAATGLLIIPGIWLLTRWSLFAPAIVHEGLAPRAALARSNELVKGAFWIVAGTVSVSVLLEHAVIHGAAHGAGVIVTAVVTAAVSGPAAFTISVVYERLAGDVHAGAGAGSAHHRPVNTAA
jgi:hypothetical protein